MSLSTDGAARRILIVDDQVSNVRLLEHTFRRAGYVEVASTTDPTQVAAMHAEHHYDLIVLDLQMPGLNGFQVMQQLREAGPADGVEILVMSADPSLMVQALEAGGDSFLSKPFLLPAVLARVALLLQKVAAEQQESKTSPLTASPRPSASPEREPE